MMKNKKLDIKLSEMNKRLTEIIKKNGYNLQNTEVISYSQKIDRVLEVYVKVDSTESLNGSSCPMPNKEIKDFETVEEFY